MKSINTYEQHKELTGFARHKGLRYSNLFYLPGDIKDRIKNRKWKYELYDDCLMFFEDADEFYRCFYYVGDNKAYEVQLDKDAVIELPFSDQFKETHFRQIERIHELGFVLQRQSAKMILTQPMKKDVSCVRYASIDDFGDIKLLLNSSFDKLFAYLDNDNDLMKNISLNKVFVIKKDDVIIGVLNSDSDMNKATIKQLAVKPGYRDLGYGTDLVQFYINEYDVDEYYHWVDLNNDKAISFYRKFGYNFSVKKANEYTRRIR